MNTLILGRWLHSYEEDDDGVETYRPADHSFPPSRGRKGFEIYEDGRFVELAIAPTDGTLERQGRWSEGDDGRLDVRMEDGTSYALEVVTIEEDSLRVRRR